MSIRYLTAGESHGRGLTGIIEGIPSGLSISIEDIHFEMKRRKLGHGRGARQKMETDEIEILSGVRHGLTIGSPISLLLYNRDWVRWTEIMSPAPIEGPVKRELLVPRPGHADYVGGIKYQHRDMRNVLERASARETAMRVAIASIARKFLAQCGIVIASRVLQIGTVRDTEEVEESDIPTLNAKVDQSPVRCVGKKAEEQMIKEITAAGEDGDTLGGIIEIFAAGAPTGLGSYAQWDRRLEGDIGKQFLGLNAIKGVEIGLGFRAAETRGSEAHDHYLPGGSLPDGKFTGLRYSSNRSGGIDGGMTTGQPIVVRAAMKPLATLMQPLPSVRVETNEAEPAHIERSDVCAVPAAAVIGESLLALTLAEHLVEKFGGDSMFELENRIQLWRSERR